MILSLDTSGPLCRMALYADGQWFDADWQADRQLAKLLLGKIEQAVQARGGQGVRDLSGIIIVEGPGSYTGLRIGLTVANTLADSMSIPIVGVQGDTWRIDGVRRIEAGENDRLVMPVYGGLPHITTPRK